MLPSPVRLIAEIEAIEGARFHGTDPGDELYLCARDIFGRFLLHYVARHRSSHRGINNEHRAHQRSPKGAN